MFTCIYIHLCAFTYIYILVHLKHLQTFSYFYAHLLTLTYIYTHLRTFTSIYIHICALTYAYIHLRAFTYIFARLRTYIRVEINTCQTERKGWPTTNGAHEDERTWNLPRFQGLWRRDPNTFQENHYVIDIWSASVLTTADMDMTWTSDWGACPSLALHGAREPVKRPLTRFASAWRLGWEGTSEWPKYDQLGQLG